MSKIYDALKRAEREREVVRNHDAAPRLVRGAAPSRDLLPLDGHGVQLVHHRQVVLDRLG